MRHPRPFRFTLLVLTAIAMAPLTGCMRGLMYYAPGQRKIIDRSIVDYPGGYVLKVVLHNLTGPIDVEEDADGNLILLESGRDGYEPRLFCFKPDGTFINIYPTGRSIPDIAPFNLIHTGFHIYGPAGGLALANGKIYVSHRDENGLGVITAFNYDGTHFTVASNIPAQGDNGMSDIAVNPIDGRIWFAVGSASNSGVVGLDNWPWVKHTPEFCDKSFFDLKLNGYQFKSPNPDAGIFGGSEVAVTAPYEPFNVSGQLRIRKSETPTGAASIPPTPTAAASASKPTAFTVRFAGLAYNQFGSLYFTAGGMELRGTRPIADDPDALLAFKSNTWYGFPDYSTDLQPITEDRFRPKGDMVKLLEKSGYPEISFLFDHNASRQGFGLMAPIRDTLLQTTFPSLSGAGNFDFVPGTGPFQTNSKAPPSSPPLRRLLPLRHQRAKTERANRLQGRPLRPGKPRSHRFHQKRQRRPRQRTIQRRRLVRTPRSNPLRSRRSHLHRRLRKSRPQKPAGKSPRPHRFALRPRTDRHPHHPSINAEDYEGALMDESFQPESP